MGRYGLGLIKQQPDERDYIYKTTLDFATLPTSVDISTSGYNPPIWDQGELGACTAFSTNRMRYFAYGKDGYHNDFTPSFLFQYYNSRELEGTVSSDSGATIRDALRAGTQWGMTSEKNWPYNPSNPGPFTEKPPQSVYDNAKKHTTTQYQAIDNSNASLLEACLAEGWPFVIGIECFNEIFNAPGGLVPLPTPDEQSVGGHALCFLGYDSVKQVFKFANSWGEGWGDNGFGYLPYAYLTNTQLSYDTWTIRVQH